MTQQHETAASSPHKQRLQIYLELIRWHRPAGTYLLLWPTLSALFLAAKGFPGWHLLIVFGLGTWLMRSAGCVINDVADRHFDKHVERTAKRPITTGQVGVKEALYLAGVLILLAFCLVLSTSLQTIAWSFFALVISVAYPFTKRFFSMPQAVLGIAFSLGIPMAFSAVQGQVPWVVAPMVLGNLFWVLAYDTEYAMVDREDDLRLGLHTSAITLGRFDVLGIMVFYVFFIALWVYVGHQLDLGKIYATGVGLASLLAASHYHLIKGRTREACFKAFQLNHWLGFAIFIGVAFDSCWGN
jgi:4-hydroxybenzoate polyprenyltransferase